MMNLNDGLYRPNLNYIKKECFTGSNEGTRFLFQKASKDGEDVINTCIWPEPFSFEKTEEEKKEYKDFPLTTEGLQDAIAWVLMKCNQA